MDGSPVALTVPSCLRAAAADSPDVEAVVDGDLRLTYAALNARADQFARAVIAAGVRPGEGVSIWAPNSAQWKAGCPTGRSLTPCGGATGT